MPGFAPYATKVFCRNRDPFRIFKGMSQYVIWLDGKSISGSLPFPGPGDTRMEGVNEWADRTLRPKNPNMVTHYEDSQGKARIKGGSALKQSQSYPLKFLNSNISAPSPKLAMWETVFAQNSLSQNNRWIRAVGSPKWFGIQ